MGVRTEKDWVLGIDIGTQGTKALVVDSKGNIQEVGTSSYSFEIPRPGWSEQDPQIWWKAVISSLKILRDKGISLSYIRAVGVSGQMHSSVLLGEDDEVVRPAILWNDVRTTEECAEIEEMVGEKHVYRITKNAVLPGFTAPKLRWIQKNEPDRYRVIRRVMLPKDYIVFRLTGERSTDVSDASGTALFDVAGRKWSEVLMEELGFSPEWFPEVHESRTVVGRVTAEAARATGLPEGIPVVAGAGDNAAAALGNGVFQEGKGIISVGTSGTVFVPLSRVPDFDAREERLKTVHLFCHCLPDTWHTMGVTLSAGMSLSWFCQQFEWRDFEEMLSGVQEIPPGSDGLLFLPYINGERTPHNDPYARGVFLGISYRHSAKHFVRAVLEGVAFSLRDCLELIEKATSSSPKELYLTGGAVKSRLWSQIFSDVLKRRLIGYEDREGPALGAAFLAGLGIGLWNSPGDLPYQVGSIPRITETYAGSAEVYDQLYRVYRHLYPSLKETYQILHAANRIVKY
jgi:xylulokinase